MERPIIGILANGPIVSFVALRDVHHKVSLFRGPVEQVAFVVPSASHGAEKLGGMVLDERQSIDDPRSAVGTPVALVDVDPGILVKLLSVTVDDVMCFAAMLDCVHLYMVVGFPDAKSIAHYCIPVNYRGKQPADTLTGSLWLLWRVTWLYGGRS
jgi:hypothetical protein